MSSTTLPDATAHPPVHPAPGPTIGVPISLPRRLYGDHAPIRHLSQSSHQLFVACPEAWRRRYLLGEKQPASPAMVLGTLVDRALSAMYAARLAGQTPEPGDVLALYDQGVEPALADQRQGVAWTADEPRHETIALGRRAVALYLDELAPYLGRPVAVQREAHIRLAPACQWTVEAHLDLETERVDRVAVDPGTSQALLLVGVDDRDHPGAREQLERLDGPHVLRERSTRAIVDYKVKKKLLSALDVDDDLQAGLYLAIRDLEGDPADEFTFAVLRRPDRHGAMAAQALATTRDARRLRGALARVAVMAQTIVALYERLGPEQPWPMADPGGWRCSARWCQHFADCPGGRGL